MENFDFNNIEKYLREGGNPETIAKAFADRLNTTIHAIDDESNLNKASADVADAWNSYVNVYFGIHKLPAGTIVEDWYINNNDIDTIIDTLVKTIPAINKYAKALDNFSSAIFQPAKMTANNTAVKTKNKVNDIVDDFFSKYGI